MRMPRVAGALALVALTGCAVSADPLVTALDRVEAPSSWEILDRTAEDMGVTGGCSIVAGPACPHASATWWADAAREQTTQVISDALVAADFDLMTTGGDCASEGTNTCRVTFTDGEVQLVALVMPSQGGTTVVEVRAAFIG
jgi:hypothetical protein